MSLLGNKQKKPSWVTSSFDGFDSSDDPDKKGRKRSRQQESNPRHSYRKEHQELPTGTELWVDLHCPTIRDELAVHKKKLQETESWLVESLAGMKGRQYLLLTGQAGCGKTTTMKVLAREADLNIQEWLNPTSTPFTNRTSDSSYDPTNTVPETSLTLQFQEFFIRAMKYRSICGIGNKASAKSLVLIEDLPNTILRNPKEFHEVLRKHNHKGKNPVVFIITDSPNQQSNVKNLFPPEIQNELSIVNISFNPIATGLLVRALNRIVTIENFKGQPLPSRDAIQAFADASNGDVRSAVNALQFACMKDVHDLEKLFSKSSKPNKSKKIKSKSSSSKDSRKTADALNNLVVIGAKDPTLLMFRALGKVLYCKRNDELGILESLPKHLQEHERTPLQENPESIYEHSTLAASSFSLFLHQNCIPFYSNINELSSVLNTFTDADVIASEWNQREKLEHYAASVSIRGVMHRNDGSSPKLGWKPLTKPEWYAANKKVRERLYMLRDIYKMTSQTIEELTTVMVPFRNKISQIQGLGSSLQQEIGSFKKYKVFSSHGERLNEIDVEEENQMSEVTHEFTSNYQSQIGLHNENHNFMDIETTEDTEDDFLIEEFEE